MATQTVVGKVSGAVGGVQLPVVVYDDGDATLSVSAALAAAEGAAPSTYGGLPQNGEPSLEQLSDWAWSVTINYSTGTVFAFQSTERYDFQVGAEVAEFDWATPVARFPGSAFDYQGFVSLGGGLDNFGAVQQPGQRTLGRAFLLDASAVTASLVQTLTPLVRAGAVNSVAVGAYPAGTLQVVEFGLSQISDQKYAGRIGWSYKPNVSGQTRGTITGISYNGHDFVYSVGKPKLDRTAGLVRAEGEAVYVVRPRPYVDLAQFGVAP